MDQALWVVTHFWWVAILAGAAVFHQALGRLFGIVIVPNNKIGVVIKKFGLMGSSRLPDGHIIALNKEAGVQADTLAPGMHIGFWPWQYTVDIEDLIDIQPGQLGVVEARDGSPLGAGRVLADVVECDSFQDARKFLTGGGQRGVQLAIIKPGQFRINPRLFSVRVVNASTIPNDKVGLVTTLDGKPLTDGEIAGASIQGHSGFQDGQAFINKGGFKGRQEQVLMAGTYFLNPAFVNVELIDLTTVPIGYVGVVISYVGDAPEQNEGNHANIVSKGEKGVWEEALDPGRYAINSYIQRIELVPTTNIVLNWATAKTEAHNLDANLSTITVRSSDGFSFNLDVSQIIHIAPKDASLVIARFGNMQNLVTQVLEPLIGNYFRNSAQSSDIIVFLQERSKRQADAKAQIQEALDTYSVQAVDTLIGDISPPAELMKTLTDRKVAQQMSVTYEQQRLSEVARQALEEASALANTRAQIVAASRNVETAELLAQAKVKAAEGDAKSKTINAEADAKVLVTVGDATANQTSAVGGAEAEVLQKKVDAVGREAYAAMQITDFLATHQVQLTPQVLVGGGADGRSGTIADAMLGFMLANKVNPNGSAIPDHDESGA